MEPEPKPREESGETKEYQPPEPEKLAQGGEISFPIIGIGASAGGLEALEFFLKNVPPLSGMAFIIVQHLDPTHKGIMAELLQRTAAMPVSQITDGTVVKSNNVYIIPPNKELTLFHGVLRLFDPVKPRGLRLPIDFFFRSLADDLGELSIGVILSGMGSDGMLGLRAIKEVGGGAFVQDPLTSKFDGMPRSAINAGLADVVAPVEQLPGKIIDFFHHRPHLGRYSEIVLENKTQSAFEKIMLILRHQTGNDFSLYKKSTMYRRIERRMGIHNIERINDYVRFLQDNTTESDLLFNELLIGVTSFFRDPSSWEKLKSDAIPLLLASRPEGGLVRAWSAGCSTGEEAYSLAMVFMEELEKLKLKQNYTIQIFATDIDKHAIDIAREGSYPQNIVADVSEERLLRFFSKSPDGGYRVNKNIREKIVFAHQNLIKDPPFTMLDILICRNLMIYLEPELQKRLVPLFHYSLNPKGYLFLGSAENMFGNTELFTQTEGSSHIFKRLPNNITNKFFDFAETFTGSFSGSYPKKYTETPKDSHESISHFADRLILTNYAPTSVLTSRQGDIVYINGRTGNYLEPISGKANWNIFAMVREGLKYPLSHTFENAVRTQKKATVKDVVITDNGKSLMVDLTVEPVIKPDQLAGMFLLVFTEKRELRKRTVTAKQLAEQKLSPDKAKLVEEINSLRSELIATHEDMLTSQEELKSMNEELLSSNEELQSTNEELQSTNEELSTAKEEMQSLNEELLTVNQELQGKLDELGRTSDDMKNLLNSTEIATLFLDKQLNIRSFTKAMTGISKLIALDKGRSFTYIASTLNYPELLEDARVVYETLVFKEKQISTTDGRWFLVRIMPYCTQENHINGLVITFIDISVRKKLELQLFDIEHRFLVVFKQISKGCLFMNRERIISMVNPAAEHFFYLTQQEMTGKSFKELNLIMVSEDGVEFTEETDPFTRSLRSGKEVKGVIIGCAYPHDKRYHWIMVNTVPQHYQGDMNSDLLYVEFEEISDPRKKGNNQSVNEMK